MRNYHSALDSGQTKKYRHEYKYLIDCQQLYMLRAGAASVMTLDSHSSKQGNYLVRSLYFDDIYDSNYYANEDGTDPREKFRVRIYNGSADLIKLELKRKEAGKTLKETCVLTEKQGRDLASGKTIVWQEDMPFLLKKLCINQKTNDLRPKIIVEYNRQSYICSDGNVRVTFDKDLRASTNFHHFYDKQIVGRPIMSSGQYIMEVKYDEFLPDYIYRTLQIDGLQQITFSKFYLCRKLGGIVL